MWCIDKYDMTLLFFRALGAAGQGSIWTRTNTTADVTMHF